MSRDEPHLVLRTSPFLKRGITTPRVMVDVIIALLPVTIASAYYFGLAAVLLVLSSIAGAVFIEWIIKRKQARLSDGSAILTGLLLGLTLPPALPLWMAFLGGVVAIGLGRLVFGGLGNNLFNPALVGRAFLQAAFPTAITTWSVPSSSFFDLPSSTLAFPLLQGGELAPDVISSATPLAGWSTEPVTAWALFAGESSGSLGETAGILILLGGAYLIARRAMDWRIVASILLTVAIFTGLLHTIDAEGYPTAWYMIGSGGLLFGAVFMATDPVTSPMTRQGVWVFGAGVGILIVLIRLFGGLPEGVMYAILLMNAATPLINRYLQPRPFGRTRKD